MSYDTLVMKGTKYVLVPETDFMAMTRGAPPLPPANARGERAALAFADASIARNIVARREAVDLSQADLAKAAGVRPDILHKAETGVNIPSVRTLTKIETALSKAEATGRRRQVRASSR